VGVDRRRVGAWNGVATLVSGHRSFTQMAFMKAVAVVESQQVVVELNHDLPLRRSHKSGEKFIQTVLMRLRVATFSSPVESPLQRPGYGHFRHRH
jgi:hypothetical protein